MNESRSLFPALMGSFLKIGLFGFGGGYAMLPLIQREVVVHRGWIEADAFTDLVALTQTLPGPIATNAAINLGFTAARDAAVADAAGVADTVGTAAAWMPSPLTMGLLGAVVATICVCLPSFVLMYGLGGAFDRLRRQRRTALVMVSLRPVVIGLIGAAALLMMATPGVLGGGSGVCLWPQASAVAIFAGVLLLMLVFRRLNPVWLLVLAGAAGYVVAAP